MKKAVLFVWEEKCILQSRLFLMTDCLSQTDIIGLLRREIKLKIFNFLLILSVPVFRVWLSFLFVFLPHLCLHKECSCLSTLQFLRWIHLTVMSACLSSSCCGWLKYDACKILNRSETKREYCCSHLISSSQTSIWNEGWNREWWWSDDRSLQWSCQEWEKQENDPLPSSWSSHVSCMDSVCLFKMFLWTKSHDDVSILIKKAKQEGNEEEQLSCGFYSLSLSLSLLRQVAVISHSCLLTVVVLVFRFLSVVVVDKTCFVPSKHSSRLWLLFSLILQFWFLTPWLTSPLEYRMF